jgi:uncharacterized protein
MSIVARTSLSALVRKICKARRAIATVWYIVAADEIHYAKCSIHAHLRYDWVGHVLVLHTGLMRPPEFGDLERIDKRVRELWHPFGVGFEAAIEAGGFDQVSARNRAAEQAEQMGDEWVVQCDADEVFTDAFGDVLRSTDADVLATSVYHLTGLNTFWVRPEQLRYTPSGEVMYSPHRRAWRSALQLRYAYSEQRLINRSRHCGPSCEDVDAGRIRDVSGVFHIHFHYLLKKTDWRERKSEGVLDESPIPDTYTSALAQFGDEKAIDPRRSLRLATDVFVLRRDGADHIAYVPLKHSAFFTDDAGAKLISELQSGRRISSADVSTAVIQQLSSIGALAEAPEARPAVQPLLEFKPLEATLLFNESCNLGCAYCYAKSEPTKGQMSWEVAEAAVRLVIENASLTDQHVASIRYLGGGEPTISWELLERCNNYARDLAQRRNVNVWIRLITNGTLIDCERAVWLKDNVDYVTLSFEILPELQSLRQYASGKSSYERVVETIGHLARSGVPFEIRSTVTERFIGLMERAVEHCHRIGGIRELRFEPVSEIGRARDTGTQGPVQRRFVEEFIKARRRGSELGINVRNKMTRNIDRIGPRFCDAEFSVGANGKVSGCHRFSRESVDGFDMFQFGNYLDGKFDFDMARLNKLRSYSVHSFDECSTCFAKWNCAGECLSKRVSGNKVAQQGSHCDIVRGLLAHMIAERLSQNADIQ